MQLRNKIFNIWNILNEYFIESFLILLSILFLFISIFNFKILDIKNYFILYSGLIFGFLVFFLWLKKQKEVSAMRKYLIEFFSHIFIIGLSFITLSNFVFFVNINPTLINTANHFIVLITIFSGFITFYFNKDRISKEAESEHANEIINEEKRHLEFPNKFPIINKIPILNLIIKWLYKQGYVYSLVIIIILSIFVLIKVPYMSLSFTGAHNMKYSSYVEPAKHMIEHGLLWNQIKYQADPITIPDGRFYNFGGYPIMEWGIVTINKMFPSNSIELNARIFMTLLGIILFILIYQVLKEFLSKKQVILILLLLSFNVIIQFFTYVTVLDPINLIFLFISLYFLINGLKENNYKNLFLSGIVAGIGINIKYHAFIFYFPIFIILLFFYKKISEEKRISYFLIILPNFLLQTIFFRTSFRYLPTNFILYFSIYTLLAVVHFYVYKNIEKILNLLECFLKNKIKIFYYLISLLSIIILYLILNIEWIQNLFSDFITDKYLIFNWNMYGTLLNKELAWVTPVIYYFSTVVLLFLIFIKNRKIKLITLSFIISSSIYFILTSKVLYFHEYYHHIIIFTFILCFSFIYHFIKIFKNILSKLFIIIIIILVLVTILKEDLNKTRLRLSMEKPEVVEVAKYINSNLEVDQFFIYSTNISTSVGFYSDRFSLYESLSSNYNNELMLLIKKDLANQIDLKTVMDKYKIKLYITEYGPNDKNNEFSYLFINEENPRKNSSIPERTSIILCAENKECYSSYRFLNEKGFDIFNTKIKPFLYLKEKIGESYIYEFI